MYTVQILRRGLFAGRFLGRLFCACTLFVSPSAAEQQGLALTTPQDVFARLQQAYPAAVKSLDGNDAVLADGTRLPLRADTSEKDFASWLAAPDLFDMFRFRYPVGAPLSTPPENFDPGRARNEAFFKKLYGDCLTSGVEKNLVDVVWLPKKSGVKLKFSSLNGAAEALEAVSKDLDTLPDRFDKYLMPVAGTYNCRPVAGTNQLSAHGYGAAIDISTEHAHYWRWSAEGPAGRPRYQNEIPAEIVAIFEKYGFIWGGRWYHYDTMHFEYRPELNPIAAR